MSLKIADQISKMIDPLRRRVMLMIGRGVIKTVTASGAIQVLQLQLMKDEVRDKVEQFQEYGFTSRPPIGTEAIVIFVGGSRDHGVTVATENRKSRKRNLELGEVAIYTDEEDSLHFKRSRELHVRSNKFKFQGETHELMQQLKDLAEKVEEISGKLSTTTTNTIFGPMKLNDFTFFEEKKNQVAEIKNHINELKA